MPVYSPEHEYVQFTNSATDLRSYNIHQNSRTINSIVDTYPHIRGAQGMQTPSPIMEHPGTDHSSTLASTRKSDVGGTSGYDEKGGTPRSFERSISKKHVERGAQKLGDDQNKKYNVLECNGAEPYKGVP
jgi:hypothetical protein